MKPIEAKIPVSVIVVGVIVLIASVVIITLFSINRKNVKQFDFQYDSLKVATCNIIKSQEDTIRYYKGIIGENEAKIIAQNESIKKLKGAIAAIPDEVSKYEPNVIYDKINEYLSEKVDDQEYPFSGNQITEIYGEHLYVKEIQKGVEIYETQIATLMFSIENKDLELKAYNDIVDAKNKLLKESNIRMYELESDFNKQVKRKKIWRALTPSGLAVGVIIGLLI
jgi:hypothetical protein